MTDARRSRRTALALVSALLLLLAVACSSDDGGSDDESSSATTAADATTSTTTAEPAALDVTSTDYAYALEETSVPAGLVTVNQTNDGDEAHQVTLIKLEDGETAEDLAAAMAGPEGEQAASQSSFGGGPNAVDPGESNSATVSLEEGDYALICFIPAADGEAHFQKGMVGQVSVTAAEGPAAAPPDTVGTIHMADYTYTVPDDFTGQGAYEIVNDGPQAHELTISTAANTADGGLAAIAPGATAYVELDLDAGDYTWFCFVGDVDTGAPHFALGMQLDVTAGGGGGGSGGATTTTG